MHLRKCGLPFALPPAALARNAGTTIENGCGNPNFFKQLRFQIPLWSLFLGSRFKSDACRRVESGNPAESLCSSSEGCSFYTEGV